MRPILPLLAALLTAATAAGQVAVGVPPSPVRAEASAGSAGVFVGVNEFTADGGVGGLNYAVNDAVELAHLFSLELRLIPPRNVTLCLSGDPDGDAATAHLAALRAAGATVGEARKSPILVALSKARRAGKAPADVLVVACSSHGFSAGEDAYLMPRDGLIEFLSATAVALDDVEGAARLSNAGHKLLLVDACQNRVSGTKSATGASAAAAMSPAFAAALAEPTGQAKLASCEVGQFSLELPALRQGVFTAALLEALRGRAGDRDGDGLIRLEEVQPALIARVSELVAAYNAARPASERVTQTPTYHGPEAARRLPLAVPATDAATLTARLAARVGSQGYDATLHARLSAALEAGIVKPDLRREAERFADRGGRFFARIVAGELPTGDPAPNAVVMKPAPAATAPRVAAGPAVAGPEAAPPPRNEPPPMRLRATVPKPRVLRGHEDFVCAVAVTPDGKLIVSGSGDKTLRVWDLGTSREERVLKGHQGYVRAVATTPDGHHIVSSGYTDRTVRVWDMTTGQEKRVLQHNEWVNPVAVTPDGTRIVSGSEDSTLCVWDMATGRNERVLRDGGLVEAVAVTPDGRRAVSGSSSGTLRVWELATGREEQIDRWDKSPVLAVAVTPDGRRAVSGSGPVWGSREQDFTLRVWDLESGRKERVLRGHEGGICAVAVTPDGKQIVSGSIDKTLRVWNLATGREKRVLRGHEDQVLDVAITPDGRYIVSGSADRTLRVWDAFEPDR